MRRLRPVRQALVTLLAGGLVGYAAVAVGSYAVTQAAGRPTPGSGEPPDVHSFMETYVVRAASDPESLTYLGGARDGAAGVHLYVVGLKDETGTSVLAPVKITFAAGRVIDIE